MGFKVFIENKLLSRRVIVYTLELLFENKLVLVDWVAEREQADWALASDKAICSPFYQLLAAQDYDGLRLLARGSYFFYDEIGREDLLASIFYLVNCLQEYEYPTTDEYGRFPMEHSLQYRERIIEINIVQQLIDRFYERDEILREIHITPRKSAFFLTHDIDTVYGAKNQNGRYALDTGRLGTVPGLLCRHYLGTPDWLNMDKILDLEHKYGFSSTFYFLAIQNKENADYYIISPAIKKQMAYLLAHGASIGIHKAMNETSFIEELSGISSSISKPDFEIKSNRYHFLKFQLPQAWEEIEGAGLRMDTSLGFSQQMGFRNSYGLPFRPYNIKENRPYRFTAVPMTIMDRTFFNQKKPIPIIERELIDWLDANRFNSLVTINFHNNFFDAGVYAGYDRLYETLLQYFKEEGWECRRGDSL